MFKKFSRQVINNQPIWCGINIFYLLIFNKFKINFCKLLMYFYKLIFL